MKTQTIILWILILIIIDQVVKIIINAFFLDYNFEIIPSILEFKPVFNQKYSYLNVLLNEKLNINFGLFPHLILFLFAISIIAFVYDFYKNIINSKLLDFAFMLYVAGWSCALIGNLIWTKGILDYIYLKPLFIFDLKDIYINSFTFLLLLALIQNRSKIKGVKMSDFMLQIKKRLGITKG